MKNKTGIIVVDLQEDFTELKNGALAVPNTGQEYVEKVRKATEEYNRKGLLVYATQDWHPKNHCSFAVNHPGTNVFETIELAGRKQTLWPVHCVMHTPGAEILLPAYLFARVIQKGTDPEFDSYSGFADDGGASTGLENSLRADGIENLIIYGLATDYCVKATVMDAIKAGFNVKLRIDLCRGVARDTTEASIHEMIERGAEIIEG